MEDDSKQALELALQNNGHVKLEASKIWTYGFSPAEQIRLDYALMLMPQKIRRWISDIIKRESTHFEKSHAAHFDPHWQRICFNKIHPIYLSTIWHEAAHAYHSVIETKMDEAWRKLTDPHNVIYGNWAANREDGGCLWIGTDDDGPDNNCLTPYASLNIREDVAVTVEGAYSVLYGEQSLAAINLLKIPQDENSIFWQKLKQLHLNKFLKDKQYKRLLKILRARYKS